MRIPKRLLWLFRYAQQPQQWRRISDHFSMCVNTLVSCCLRAKRFGKPNSLRTQHQVNIRALRNLTAVYRFVRIRSDSNWQGMTFKIKPGKDF